MAASNALTLTEVTGDLFGCPEAAALAHCISEDVHMGAGIAKIFKAKYGGVEELRRQGAVPGGLAVLSRDGRYIYYMVTKKKYHQKPTYATVQQSLECVRLHCEANGVRRVCMPRIACGLDRLQWHRIADLIREVFDGSDVQVTVYSL